MTTAVVDIVNFNADASCLSSRRWLEALSNGEKSQLCAWLNGYVETESKVTLGFIGGTLADISVLNHEAIDLINAHADIFEIIIRPFSHDIALTRTDLGFRKNFELGSVAIRREFSNIVDWYLPPEFMLTNRQLSALPELGVDGVFINSGRYEPEIQRRLSPTPYILTGVGGIQVPCIPFESSLTPAFLRSIQELSEDVWLDCLSATHNPVSYLWRDGESAFLIPDGVERERSWLNLSRKYQRVGLSAAIRATSFITSEDLPSDAYRSYPVHSFAAWMKEFRMIGYLRNLEKFEQMLGGLSAVEQVVWLQAINSDVLSAVEKGSPTVRLKSMPCIGSVDHYFDYKIWRTERGFEGEDCLQILDQFDSAQTQAYLRTGSASHLLKIRARLTYLGIEGF